MTFEMKYSFTGIIGTSSIQYILILKHIFLKKIVSARPAFVYVVCLLLRV